MKIILASGSPRRRELMKYITNDFEAVSLDCDETLPEGTIPMDASAVLAERKAFAASEKYPDCVVIGCDTTVIADGKILGKPHDRTECLEFMEMLSGNTHYVVTSCCLVYKGQKECFSSVTDVTFRKMSRPEIEAYASTDEPYDKAGGYGIQGIAGGFIDSIDGDFFNVVGLPVTELFNVLKEFINNIKGELS
ncbi:MAG: septum formation protein Maf [Ruminococcus sp.]|nr:septum formation protein Maf [Ruminococcus sp.]